MTKKQLPLLTVSPNKRMTRRKAFWEAFDLLKDDREKVIYLIDDLNEANTSANLVRSVLSLLNMLPDLSIRKKTQKDLENFLLDVLVTGRDAIKEQLDTALSLLDRPGLATSDAIQPTENMTGKEYLAYYSQEMDGVSDSPLATTGTLTGCGCVDCVAETVAQSPIAKWSKGYH
jgi:hypothetical protein